MQFLEHILLELKHAGIVRARRGAKGGYWLARPADDVTIADVVRAVEGPIAHVQSSPPEAIEYRGNAKHLKEVWIAVRASLRTVLEQVTLADLVSGELPAVVEHLTESPDAWASHVLANVERALADRLQPEIRGSLGLALAAVMEPARGREDQAEAERRRPPRRSARRSGRPSGS